MKCPFCNGEDTQVKDSRPTEDNAAIRRRRECPNCDARFTTFERVQLREIMVIKNDGSREPFDRDKLMRSVRLPLQKRPIDAETMERCVNQIVRELEQGSRVLGANFVGGTGPDAAFALGTADRTWGEVGVSATFGTGPVQISAAFDSTIDRSDANAQVVRGTATFRF